MLCMLCIYMHTHTYIRMYVRTYVHTYIHIHTYIHTYTHTYIHTYIHSSIRYVYTYIHTHTYIHTYIHTNILIVIPITSITTTFYYTVCSHIIHSLSTLNSSCLVATGALKMVTPCLFITPGWPPFLIKASHRLALPLK